MKRLCFKAMSLKKNLLKRSVAALLAGAGLAIAPQAGAADDFYKGKTVDFVVNDSLSPYLPSRLFFHFLIITKISFLKLCAFGALKKD